MFGSFDISVSALTAQRTRMDTIASNTSNFNAHLKDGTPYRRLFTVFESQRTADGGAGVRVAKILEDHQTPFRMVREPGHPYADAQGFVKYPNVDLATEQINSIETYRAYEANITAIEATKSMMNSTLRLLA